MNPIDYNAPIPLRLRRGLYDQAYLDADCDPTRIPLKEENGVDSR